MTGHIEEYLHRVHVTPPRALTGKIVIAEYDPTWPDRFRTEKTRLTELLGSTALAVEHVGSTSVPGLAAKPVIDIDLIVADSTDETSYLPALESTGYVLRVREPDWYEHRLFKGPDADVNLHVFGSGAEEHRRHLLLRDWLRGNDSDRDRYAAVKRELARRQWTYTAEYAEAKSQVIADLLANAGYVRPPHDLGGS